MIIDSLPKGTLHIADALSITTLLASMANALPSVAALLTIVWTALRIYETKTVQSLIGRSRRDVGGD